MEEQDKYTLEELEGYRSIVLAALTVEKAISFKEGTVCKKIFNTLMYTLNVPQTKQGIIKLRKLLDEGGSGIEVDTEKKSILEQIIQAIKF